MTRYIASAPLGCPGRPFGAILRGRRRRRETRAWPVGGIVHNTKRMTPPPSFSQVFAELQAERTMSPLVARRVFESILAGGWTPVQIGAFLVSLELLGQTSSVIAAAAKAMRAKMVVVKHD